MRSMPCDGSPGRPSAWRRRANIHPMPAVVRHAVVSGRRCSFSSARVLMNKSLPPIVALVCAACQPASVAQQAPALATVQVTATRTELPADQALAAVTLITRTDIERLQPVSVQDLL